MGVESIDSNTPKPEWKTGKVEHEKVQTAKIGTHREQKTNAVSAALHHREEEAAPLTDRVKLTAEDKRLARLGTFDKIRFQDIEDLKEMTVKLKDSQPATFKRIMEFLDKAVDLYKQHWSLVDNAGKNGRVGNMDFGPKMEAFKESVRRGVSGEVSIDNIEENFNALSVSLQNDKKSVYGQ
jgi:hypothetical protein